MAKEKETKKTEVLSEDNVMEDVRKGNLIGKADVDAALAQINKETEEKKKNEAKECIVFATFATRSSVRTLRDFRRKEKVIREKVSRIDNLQKQILGGEITPAEYYDKLIEAEREIDKMMDEAEKESAKEREELDASYEGQEYHGKPFGRYHGRWW